MYRLFGATSYTGGAVKLISLLIAGVMICSCSGSDDQDSTKKDQKNINLDIGQADWIDDTAKNVDIPDGFGKFCLDESDCEDWGLSCFKSSDTDVNAICSQACEGAADCPTGLICSTKGEQKVCKFPSFCDECTGDQDCGPDAKCLEDGGGRKFCTPHCIDDSTCPMGGKCKKFDIEGETNPFYCYPKAGVCIGDGTHCQPCKEQTDCNKAHVCHFSETFPESFCAQKCESTGECPLDTVCVSMITSPWKVCLPSVHGETVETCFVGSAEFCEPCQYNFQCRSEVCYFSNALVGSEKYCSKECPQPTAGDNTKGCYSGTFCVPNHNEEIGGYACVPPPSYKCVGFKQCLGVECELGDECIDGFCTPKE